MKVDITTLEGKAAGSVNYSMPFSASIHAPTSSSAAYWQLAKRQPGTHKTKGRGEIGGPARRCIAEGHRRRPSRPGARRRSSAAVVARSARLRAAMLIDCQKGARAGAQHALSAKAKDAGHRASTRPRVKTQDQELATVRRLGLK